MDCQPITDLCKNQAEFVVITQADKVGACRWHLPMIIDEAISETGEKKIQVMNVRDYFSLKAVN